MDDVVAWLLAGDPAVAAATARDLLRQDDSEWRTQIPVRGDAAALLAAQHQDAYWGDGFYELRWTCTHYTLVELAGLGVAGDQPGCVAAVDRVLAEEKWFDGGVNPRGKVKRSDVCINALALVYCCHFGAETPDLASIVDFILGEELGDGGFNCRANRARVSHSSVHSTTCVIEGFTAYLAAGHAYRCAEVSAARDDACSFLLSHRLYRSHRSGEVMNREFLQLHHPTRWRFDVLRGLDALGTTGALRDPRCEEALQLVRQLRRSDGCWSADSTYRGPTHIRYPKPGQPHPWLTLTALRVLQAAG